MNSNFVFKILEYKEWFNKEEEYFTERFNCKNVFSNKYFEISVMILDVLNPLFAR